MPRPLPRNDADDHEFIQFRGYQTSVTEDKTGVHFGTVERRGRVVHEPVPVVDDETDPSDAPDDAVLLAVAEALVQNSPLISWGVACDICGDVFATPAAVNSHMSAHAGGQGDPADGGDGGEDDSDSVTIPDGDDVLGGSAGDGSAGDNGGG